MKALKTTKIEKVTGDSKSINSANADETILLALPYY